MKTLIKHAEACLRSAQNCHKWNGKSLLWGYMLTFKEYDKLEGYWANNQVGMIEIFLRLVFERRELITYIVKNRFNKVREI